MLTISREVPVKIGRHSWNLFPLEAFGYLLGRTEEEEILVALPSSKTSHWREFTDRWNGIEDRLADAQSTAKRYRLEILGFYCSTEQLPPREYPPPGFLDKSSMRLLIVYESICCRQCSWASICRNGQWLSRGEDYVIPRGKRARREINQRRVHGSWLDVIGPVDYSNGYQEQR